MTFWSCGDYAINVSTFGCPIKLTLIREPYNGAVYLVVIFISSSFRVTIEVRFKWKTEKRNLWKIKKKMKKLGHRQGGNPFLRRYRCLHLPVSYHTHYVVLFMSVFMWTGEIYIYHLYFIFKYPEEKCFHWIISRKPLTFRYSVAYFHLRFWLV